MRKLTGLCVLLLALASPAAAADLGGYKDAYDSGPVPGTSYGGFYMAFGIGGSFMKSSKDTVITTPYSGTVAIKGGTSVAADGVVTTCTSTTPCIVPYTGTVSQTVKSHYGLSGALADARLGYDFALGNGWFIGPFAGVSYDWASEGDLSQGFGYEGGGRIGKAIGNARLFAELGYRGEHTGLSGDFSTDTRGVLVGGGAEVALGGHMYVGARVDYVAYGSFTNDGGVKVDESQIIGLGYLGVKF